MRAALKLLATCLSPGSGASGGVFSPALFLGVAGAAAFGHPFQTMAPGLEAGIPTFATACMAAAIRDSTGAVLSGIVMLPEMTGDHSIIPPLVISCPAACAVRKAIMDDSIHTLKLRVRRQRGDSTDDVAFLNSTFTLGDGDPGANERTNGIQAAACGQSLPRRPVNSFARSAHNHAWRRTIPAGECFWVGDDVRRQESASGQKPDQPISHQLADASEHEEEREWLADDLHPEGQPRS